MDAKVLKTTIGLWLRGALSFPRAVSVYVLRRIIKRDEPSKAKAETP